MITATYFRVRKLTATLQAGVRDLGWTACFKYTRTELWEFCLLHQASCSHLQGCITESLPDNGCPAMPQSALHCPRASECTGHSALKFKNSTFWRPLLYMNYSYLLTSYFVISADFTITALPALE